MNTFCILNGQAASFTPTPWALQFELSEGICWDLNSRPVLLYFYYVICASSFKKLPLICVCLKLQSDILD